MPLQLTPEQEQRIQAIVSAGAYSSAEEALNAAVAVVETAAAADFEGDKGELEALLTHGISSPEISEDHFWRSVDCETNEGLSAHNSKQRT